MTIKRIQMRPKGDGTYPDVLHPETEDKVVQITDANNYFMSTTLDGVLDELETGKSDTSHTHPDDYTKMVPYAGTTTGTANAYSISSPAIASLAAGMAVSIKINVSSTSTSTLNWNGKGAKTIKKANGNDVTNLVTGGIYTLRYDGTNFILQGEGGSGDATASDLLSGKKASVDAGDIVGTMVDRGTVNITPNTSNQTIPGGKHSGTGVVYGDAGLVTANIKAGVTIFGVTGATNVVDTTMAANSASATEILSGEKAFVNGALVTGTMANNASPTATLTTNGATKTVPAGYSPGGTITASITNLTAPNIKSGSVVGGVTGSYDTEVTTPISASDVLLSHIGFVNGVKVTGTMANNAAPTATLTTNGATKTVPAGYSPGGTITASITNLTASNIMDGAVVGGVTGTFSEEATNPITASSVLSGKVGFVNGVKVTGTIPSKSTATITPGTTNQTITSGQYLSGTQTILGDADLVTANIKSGANIFGVAGSSKVMDTSDATASATDIINGKTAYVNGVKLVGSFIDDIIGSYTVSTDGAISVGDVCEFINDKVRKTFYQTDVSTATTIDSVNTRDITTLVLDPTRILLIYGNATTTFGYGVVLTINGTTITKGTITQLTSVNTQYLHACLLDNNRAIIVYYDATNVWGVSNMLTVTGSSISLSGTFAFCANAVYFTRVTKIDSTRVLINYADGAISQFPFAVVLNVFPTYIASVGTPVQLNSASGSAFAATLITPNKLVITFSNSSGNGLGIVANISNIDTITIGTPTVVASSTYVYTDLITIDSSRVLLAYASTSAYGYVVVIGISGNTITQYTPVTYNLTTSSRYPSLIRLDADNYIVTYKGPNSYLNSTFVTIDNTIITTTGAFQANSNDSSYTSATYIDDTRMLNVFYDTVQSKCIAIVRGYSLPSLTVSTLANPTVITNATKAHVIATSSGGVGATITATTKGIVSGLSGLIPQATYYSDQTGNLAPYQARSVIKPIGIAISDTELIITKGYWER